MNSKLLVLVRNLEYREGICGVVRGVGDLCLTVYWKGLLLYLFVLRSHVLLLRSYFASLRSTRFYFLGEMLLGGAVASNMEPYGSIN